MVGENDKYYSPVTMHLPKAIARVHHPILTPEERAKRQKMIEDAAKTFARSLLERGIELPERECSPPPEIIVGSEHWYLPDDSGGYKEVTREEFEKAQKEVS